MQGVAHAELADVQPIGRPQRLDVELDGRVLGPLVVEGIRLQIAQVRRHHRPAAELVEAVEDGPAQGRPLGRVGAGAEFVEQDQAVARRRLSRMGAMREMCELKVLSDCSRLCSSPMSARMWWKTGTLLPSPAGMCMPALGHQAEQAGRLEADRLAAGVRPGDDEQVEAECRGGCRWARLPLRSQRATRARRSDHRMPDSLAPDSWPRGTDAPAADGGPAAARVGPRC